MFPGLSPTGGAGDAERDLFSAPAGIHRGGYCYRVSPKLRLFELRSELPGFIIAYDSEIWAAKAPPRSRWTFFDLGYLFHFWGLVMRL